MLRYCRIASTVLVVLAAVALASIILATSGTGAASAAYYGYCPEGSAPAVYYQYCPPPRVPQHFQAYLAGNETPVFPAENIVLEDQFVRETVQRARPKLLLNPVEKRRQGKAPEPIQRPEEHLKCYRIFSDLMQNRIVRVSNQFATNAELVIKEPSWLCAPASKSLQGPPTQPPDDNQHYKCYGVKERVPLPDETMDLVDQFGPGRVIMRRAKLLCNPVTKERASGERVEPPRPDEHLVCYGVEALGVSQTRTVFTRDQFGSQRLHVYGPQMLCVPSTKN